MIDSDGFCVQRFTQVQTVPAVAHHNAQQQGRLTLVADQKGRRVFIAALHRRHVLKLQRFTPRHNRRVADFLEGVEGTVQTQKHLRPAGFNRTGRGQDVLVVERRKNVLRSNTQCCQPLVGERHENSFGLFADDIDLLHARHMQQTLAQ